MTKEDIKVGMIVEVRIGKVYMVLSKEDELILSRVGKYITFSHTDDLLYKDEYGYKDPQFDIMKVYNILRPWNVLDNMVRKGRIVTDNCILIWEREEYIKVGDSVEIIDTGLSYAKHVEFLEINFPEFLGRYAYGVTPRINRTYRVIGSEINTNGDGSKVLVIQYMSGQIFLIGESGVKIVK